jgi:hypothetical protein
MVESFVNNKLGNIVEEMFVTYEVLSRNFPAETEPNYDYGRIVSVAGQKSRANYLGGHPTKHKS